MSTNIPFEPNQLQATIEMIDNYKGMRNLLADVMHLAIDHAHEVAQGRQRSFETGTNYGMEANKAFEMIGGRLPPDEDVKRYFNSDWFQITCDYLDLDPNAVTEALKDQGLLNGQNDHDYVEFTPTQIQVLERLPATKEELADHIYGEVSTTTINRITRHLTNTRKRLHVIDDDKELICFHGKYSVETVRT